MADSVVEHVPTRELIITEALHCFAETGYDGTSLNDIAAGVGIRRPSLLHHFPSKEAIYAEVFRVTLQEWGARVEDAIAQQRTGWEQVDLVITTGFRFFQEHSDFVKMVRREALDGGAHLGIDLGAALRPFMLRAQAWFEREMDEGRFRRVDVEQLLFTGYSVMSSYFSDIPFLEGLLDKDPLAPDALEARLQHLRDLFHVTLSPTAP